MDKWTICNKTGDFEEIMRQTGVSMITARLLVNRGMTDIAEIRSFLNPQAGDLHSPHLLKNLDAAVELITRKISSGVRIRVVGDYDVDGIMATYILDDALHLAGADSDWYIPHRIRDGYGLNEEIISTAHADGVDTVITCDNGIAAVTASKTAAAYGMTLVITDHHELPDELPEAAVIVDPKQPEETYPCREICGAVVAAKLAQALFERLGIKEDITRYLDCMAMATICDVVALKGENHVIASLGMEQLRHTANKGLSALMEEAVIAVDTLSEYHVGFVLGPCFNATGRIDDAGLAMALLKAQSSEEAHRYAAECRNLNEERKTMTAEQEQLAVTELDAMAEQLPRVMVVEMKDCHESILGIIAGRLKERYNRPAIVVTHRHDGYKGSARSIPGYNMFEELKKCSEHLVRFGGHPMAAGLTVREGSLEAFRQALNDNCMLTADDMQHKVQIDAEVSFNLFTEAILEEMTGLAPFGQGNPAPLFAERNLYVRSIRRMGKEGNFLRFRFVNSFGHEISAVSFDDAEETLDRLREKFGSSDVDRALNGGDNRLVLTAAYVPRLNEFHDVREIQMNIKALRI